MFRKRRVSYSSDDRTIENAWRLHDAQVAWAAQADTKAAFSLTIQLALLGYSISLVGEICSTVEAIGVFGSSMLIVAGAALAATVVIPELNAADTKSKSSKDFVYFGHARHWNPKQLSTRLRSPDISDQISRQVVAVAEIAWVKHRRVAASIRIGLFGGLSLILVATTINLS